MSQVIKITRNNYNQILENYNNYTLRAIKINSEFLSNIFKSFNSSESVELIIDEILSFDEVILIIENTKESNTITHLECEKFLYDKDSLYSFLHSNCPPITNSSDFKFKYEIKDTQVKEDIKYEKVWEFRENLCAVKQKEKFGFINNQGELVIPLKYDFALCFSEGLANVGLNGQYGFIDKHENIIIPFKYDFAFEFQDGLAKVEKNGLWGYIDRYGQEIIPIQYEYLDFFEDGVCKFQIDSDDKFGLLGKSGNEILSCIYDEIGSFYESVARIKFNNKWGYVDKFGKFVIPLKFDLAFDYFNGIARVKLDGKYGFINQNGEVILPFEYAKIGDCFFNYYPIKKDNKWGLADLLGKVVVQCEYDNIEYDIEKNQMRLKKDDQYTYITELIGEYYDRTNS